jgi:hypothetical protein
MITCKYLHDPLATWKFEIYNSKATTVIEFWESITKEWGCTAVFPKPIA